MKTIAISIDEGSLAALDGLALRAGRGKAKRVNRSAVVRLALQEFLARRGKREREERDRGILRSHRRELARQAAALVADQAEP